MSLKRINPPADVSSEPKPSVTPTSSPLRFAITRMCAPALGIADDGWVWVEKIIEPTLINPTFVTHLPRELVPLAKLSPDDPTTVEVFECCINGQEIAPAYSEQNDPGVQRQMLQLQAGAETQKIDEDFLLALEHGMPPAGGLGIGIDRLVILLTGAANIRDVILFPTLAPEAQA